ncbi:MAG: TVP38/TMEM64 family protein [Planctomycetaceae bacterium]|nr:TVP38/TMEM64 family protein [Planctomycetaceae bacterium]
MTSDRESSESTPPARTPPQGPRALWLRATVLVLLAIVAAALFLRFRQELSLDALAAREANLRKLCDAHPIGSLAIAFFAYVAVTGLSLPGAVVMSVAYGWLFGFWKALVVVSFASTTGATIAFLLSRYLFGQAIQARYAERIAAFNEAIDREGAFYLFTLRLIPQVPFWLINIVMGLTRLRARTFWWVSQLGMLPGTIVFVLAGSSVKRLSEIQERGLASILDWRLAAALVLLGVAPLAIKRLLAYARPAAAKKAAQAQIEIDAPNQA